MKGLATAAALALIGLSTTAASALPAPSRDAASSPSASDLQPIQWRYHRNCGWRGGRWVVDLGGGRLVVCRPNRPGRDWVWRDDGPRHGWYNNRSRAWHYGEWNRR